MIVGRTPFELNGRRKARWPETMIHSEKSRVILRGVTRASLPSVVRECMEWCQWETWVASDVTVVLKPNLCSTVPDKWQMSNTEPAVTEAVCRILLERTKRIYIVESSHLRYTADEMFAASGYVEMAKRLGVDLVNLTEAPRTRVRCEPAGDIEMPRLLLEADALITLPVLKTHALTYFTGALKNQWGCIPQYDRILLHRYIDPMLASLAQLLRPEMALMDGILCMEGRGPTNGKPRRLDVLLASRDLVALDATAMRLVGLDPRRSQHLVIAAEQGLGAFDPEDIEVDGDWEKHRTQFEPAVLDWAVAAMNYMTRFRPFVKYALEKDTVFYPVRAFVQFLRRLGIVEGGA
jgi:uncharacterized protein (DUF362 family)